MLLQNILQPKLIVLWVNDDHKFVLNIFDFYVDLLFQILNYKLVETLKAELLLVQIDAQNFLIELLYLDAQLVLGNNLNYGFGNVIVLQQHGVLPGE